MGWFKKLAVAGSLFVSLLVFNASATTYTICASGCDSTQVETLLTTTALIPEDVIQLTEDLAEADPIGWPAADSGDITGYVTLDLAGYTLTISGANGILLNDVAYVKITDSVGGGILQPAADLGAGEYFIRVQDSSDNILIDSVDIKGYDGGANTTYGIEIRSDANGVTNVTIQDSVIHQWTQCIRSYTSNAAGSPQGIVIQRNAVYDCDQGALTGADGINFGGGNQMDNTGSIVQDNNIYNFADTGIDTFFGQNIVIRRNTIHDNVNGGDGDGIKLDVANGNTGLVVYNNKIYNLTADGNNNGIFIGEASALIYHNDIYNVKIGLYQPSDASQGSLSINNNILQHMTAGGQFVQLVTARITSLDYNTYYDFASAAAFSDIDGVVKATFADHKTAVSDDANSLDSNPLFADPANGNFTLTAGSSSIGAGTDLGDTYKLDFNNKDRDRFMPWDIGALEYLTGRRIGL